MPENRLCVGDSSDISYPYWDPEADVAHEVFFFNISTIMRVKIMIIKLNLFLYNILEKKDLFLNGFL